ncbi:Sulfhydrogenase 1 subunit gamma [uncultured archaeon]|nr:Sulfhydrogenase 1 subunit gamma [uncultured archaeon]
MDFFKKTGYLWVFILAIIPVLYLLIFPGDSVSFSNFSNSMRSIGKILGLCGMVLFSITLLLNTRLKFTEKLFFGLDKTYKAHHNIGIISFLLLLFHPLFLASQFITSSIVVAAKFLLQISNLAITLGNFALFSMELFLILTFISKFKYQTWKFNHKLLGFSYILASLHVLLISSDVSRSIFLKSYMVLFIIIGIGSFSYRTLFWKKFVKRYEYTVKSIKQIGNLTEITLETKDKPLNYIPGQFAFLSIESDITTNEPHPFTICSSPNKKDIIFSIKDLGDYTANLKNVKVGSKVKLEGPFGKFSFVNHHSNNYIFISGGIGITPFISMIRSIDDSPGSFDGDNIDLYYSVKTEKECVFLKELKEISNKISKTKKLNIYPFISEKSGLLNLEYIKNNSKYLSNSKIFICGPPNMMNSIKKQLISFGINKKNIITEEFGL